MTAIVPLTAAHFDDFDGERPTMTVWGLAVVDAGRVLGVAAIYPEAGSLMLIARFAPAGRELLTVARGKRWLLLAARRVLDLASTRHLPIYAIADTAIDGSEALLEHLGFGRYHKEAYKWAGYR